MPPINSTDLARYIEATDGLAKPWLLVLLQLQKLKEQRSILAPEDYMQQLQELQDTLVGLGEWWVGIEDEVFRNQS
jgi:hypothetical protein